MKSISFILITMMVYVGSASALQVRVLDASGEPVSDFPISIKASTTERGSGGNSGSWFSNLFKKKYDVEVVNDIQIALTDENGIATIDANRLIIRGKKDTLYYSIIPGYYTESSVYDINESCGTGRMTTQGEIVVDRSLQFEGTSETQLKFTADQAPSQLQIKATCASAASLKNNVNAVKEVYERNPLDN